MEHQWKEQKKVEMIAGKSRAEANYHGKVSKSLQRCKKDGI